MARHTLAGAKQFGQQLRVLLLRRPPSQPVIVHDCAQLTQRCVEIVVDDDVVELGGMFQITPGIGQTPADDLFAVGSTCAQPSLQFAP